MLRACVPSSIRVFFYSSVFAGVTLSLSACGGGGAGTGSNERDDDSPTPVAEAPGVYITSPAPGLFTEENEITLAGAATDDRSITQLSWRLDEGSDTSIALTEGDTVTFEVPAPVPTNGEHTLTVTAIDDDGLEGEAAVNVTVAEPNDTLAQAVELTLPFSSPELKTSSSDTDWYRFTLDALSSLSLIVTDPEGSWPDDVNVCLFDSGGALLQCFSGGEDVYTLDLSADTYFLEVFDYSSETALYELSLSSEPLPADAYEPNDEQSQAAAVELPFTSSELSLSHGDQDWFSFTLDEAGAVRVDVDSGSSTGYLDTAATLYDERGDELYYSDDDDGVDPSFATVLSAGTYYLRISLLSVEGGLGTYTLVITPETVEDDELEENDTSDAATPVTLPFEGSDLRLVYSDADWFSFTLEAESYVEVDLTTRVDSEIDSDIEMCLADENLDCLAGTSWFDEAADLAKLLEPGRYYLYVQESSYSDQVQLDYDLTIRIDAGVSDDGYEPNDSLEEAASVELNLEQEPLVLFNDDYDWFSFTLAESQMVTIDIDAQSIGSTVDATVNLVDSEGSSIASSYDDHETSDPLLAYPLAAGTYYVAISGWSPYDDHGDYLLTLEAGPMPADDALEPNDGFSTATPIAVPYESDALELVAGDEDWFQITVGQGQTLYVDVDARSEGSALYLGMTLFDDQGGVIAYSEEGDFGDPYLEQSVDAGTCYLLVYNRESLVAADLYYLSLSGH